MDLAIVSGQTVTPCGMDRGVVPLAPVAPSTHHHGLMYNYLPLQLIISKSGSVVIKRLVMKTLQYNSWNSTLNELDITTTGNKLEFVDLVVAVSLTTYQSCAVPSYSLIVCYISYSSKSCVRVRQGHIYTPFGLDLSISLFYMYTPCNIDSRSHYMSGADPEIEEVRDIEWRLVRNTRK